jgi:hypothetical protein
MEEEIRRSDSCGRRVVEREAFDAVVVARLASRGHVLDGLDVARRVRLGRWMVVGDGIQPRRRRQRARASGERDGRQLARPLARPLALRRVGRCAEAEL